MIPAPPFSPPRIFFLSYFEMPPSWSSQSMEFSLFRWLGMLQASVFPESPSSSIFGAGLVREWLCTFRRCSQGLLGGWKAGGSWTTSSLILRHGLTDCCCCGFLLWVEKQVFSLGQFLGTPLENCLTEL